MKVFSDIELPILIECGFVKDVLSRANQRKATNDDVIITKYDVEGKNGRWSSLDPEIVAIPADYNEKQTLRLGIGLRTTTMLRIWAGSDENCLQCESV